MFSAFRPARPVNQKLQFVLICAAQAVLCGTSLGDPQDEKIVSLKAEPHHHLQLHNQYVNVYSVEVAPHDAVILHRHDADAVSVMLGDSEITVKSPGKPDVHQKVAGGQLRFQPLGYVHSTSIDSAGGYRNITVELLLPQQHARNLCATVIPKQDLHCETRPKNSDASATVLEPQLASDQTKIMLIRIRPHQSLMTGDPAASELRIALDDVTTSSGADYPSKTLRQGEFSWRGPGTALEILKNDSDKEARVVTFELKTPSE
jgi:hypothetical protein